MNRPWKIAIAFGALGLGSLAIYLAGLPVWETAGSLSFGWWRFLTRVIPQQHVSVSGLFTAGVCLILLLAGLHGFLSWLARAWNAGRSDAQRWRFRWTASAIGLTLLMFVAGTAFVGMVHQSIWLATSSEPRTTMAPDQTRYGDPRNTLKMIGLGLMDYESAFQRLPGGDDSQYSGGVQHSWQTLIMPYMVISNSEYHFDQPWNAAVNRPFCSRPVEEYLIRGVPGDFRNGDGLAVSHYAGSAPLFLAARDRAIRLANLKDDTLVMGEASGNFRPWADPANLRDPADGLCRSPDSFGNTSNRGAYFLEAGGGVRFYSRATDPAVLKNLSSPSR